MLKYFKYLLRLEWKKFNANTTVRVLVAIFVFLAPFTILSVKDLFKEAVPPFPRSAVLYEFPTVWDYQGYALGNWLAPYMLGFLVIYIITSEVSNRTMRQNIITGMTKTDYFNGKMLMVLVVTTVATFIYAMSTIILGFFHTDGVYMELIFDNNNAISKFFLMTLGYLSFAMLLSFLIRRGTLTILIYFFYITMLEPLIMAGHVYYIRNSSRNYYPINSFEDLHVNPLFRIPDFFSKSEWNFSIVLPQGHAALMTTIYTSLFLWCSYKLFMRRDV